MRAPTIRLRCVRSRKFRPRRLRISICGCRELINELILQILEKAEALARCGPLGSWGATGPCTGRTSKVQEYEYSVTVGYSVYLLYSRSRASVRAVRYSRGARCGLCGAVVEEMVMWCVRGGPRRN